MDIGNVQQLINVLRLHGNVTDFRTVGIAVTNRTVFVVSTWSILHMTVTSLVAVVAPQMAWMFLKEEKICYKMVCG